MNGLDAYFDRMLDAHLEEYFEDCEDQRDGIEHDDYDDSHGPFFVNFN
jgi:hypothetical protein